MESSKAEQNRATPRTAPTTAFERPHVFSIGPSWIWLVIWAAAAGAMVPWIVSDGPAEVPLPWLGTVSLPEGMPLWLAITAGLFALICSLRCRVAVDEKARTITRWRCIGVLIPWSITTRSFEEVRFVRMEVSPGFLAMALNTLMSMPGESGEPADAGPVRLGKFLIQVVFDDRDWFNAARGSPRRMVATSEELCRILEVRPG